MKRGLIFLLIVLILFVNISIISASFTKGNPLYSITTKYSLGDFIKGWINISLTNEPVNSLFETRFNDNVKDSINLIDLLKLNNANFDCIPSDCETAYVEVANSEQKGKNFSINITGDTESKKEEIFGFKISGSGFSSIDNYFYLNVTSNASESDAPQLYIDILNDGIVEWQSHLSSENFRDEDYGCYRAPAIGTANIELSKYCEKIRLSTAPNVTIGAEIIQGTGDGGTATFTLSIDDKEGNYGSCEESVSVEGKIKCSPKNGKFRINEEKDFYVCINAKTSNDLRKYQINFETTDTCGYGVGEVEGFDFKIFAQPAKYAPVGSFILNDSEIKSSGSFSIIERDIEGYIYKRYKNNCANGCIIPIRFSGQGQEINLSEINIPYTAGVSTSTDKIYNLTETSARVSAGFQKLYLDEANFSVPSDFGESTFTLKLGTSEIFSQKISIEKIPQILSLNPRVVMAAYPTNFSVKVEKFGSSANITNYEWDFGGGNKRTTTGNSVVYTYTSTGAFNISVKINNSMGLGSSKIFNITVETPIKAVNFVLSEKLKNLDKVKKQIENFSSFYKNSINSVLNLTEAEQQLEEIQTRNASASSDAHYIGIMIDLMSLEIPKEISTTAKGDSLPFYPAEENINLEVLKKIGGGNYSTENEDKYIDALLAWNLENINTKTDFEEFSAVYDDFSKPILKVFKLEIEQKTALDYNPYLIIYKMSNLAFDKDYDEREVSEYFYIELMEQKTTITFSTSEDVDFISVPAFIAPEINRLSVIDLGFLEGPSKFIDRMGGIIVMIVVFLLVTIVGFVVYLFLQQWYKHKYEDYLFKNKNDLYNLVSYVQSSKKAGVDEKEIMKRLKKSGWKPEQMKYVMKKYSGKRTGMFELIRFGKKEGGKL